MRRGVGSASRSVSPVASATTRRGGLTKKLGVVVFVVACVALHNGHQLVVASKNAPHEPLVIPPPRSEAITDDDSRKVNWFEAEEEPSDAAAAEAAEAAEPRASESLEIPSDCISWFDGCNTCTVRQGALHACTKMACHVRAPA